MSYRTAAACLLLFAGAGGCSAAHAERQTPQWSVTFDNRALSDEQAQADLRASWARLADGSTLLASHAGSSVALRGLGADGTTRFSRAISSPTAYQYTRIVLLAANADSTGAYVAASTTNPVSHTLLYRTGSSGDFDELLQLPDWAADGAGAAVALRTLPDDSLLVLRRRAITRVASDGQLLWNFGNGEDGYHLLDATDVAVAPDGTAWVTARGGVRFAGSPAPFASVRRFLPDGQQLPQDLLRCTTCTESRATGVTVLADGQAVVVGRSGPGEPGFVAAYAADGTRRLLVDTAPGGGYDRVTHDDAGNVYALSQDTNTISALDIADGQVRWQRAGSDVTALASGVLISQRFRTGAGQLEVDAVDADGALLWTRQLEASDGSAVGGAQRVSGGVTLQLQIDRNETHCGKGPRIVTLDMAGNVTHSVAGCLTTRSQYVVGMDAQPGVGVLANTQHGATHLAPDGAQQWHVSATAACAPGASNAYVSAVEMLPNGESWVLRSCYSTPISMQAHELVRLGVDGTVLATADLGSSAALWSRVVLLAEVGGVVALVPRNDGIRWLRIRNDGTVVDDAFTELGGPGEEVLVTNAKLWPNGSASVATWQRMRECNISPPSACARPASTLLRLNGDGTERWRVEAGAFLAFVGFEEDGSSLIAESSFGQPLRLRHVSATGVAGIPFVAAGGEAINLRGAAGPVRGRYLAFSDTDLLLLDRTGNVLVRRTATVAGGQALASADAGFITSAWRSDGALVSADDLSVVAEFDVDGVDNTYSRQAYWSFADDGSVYTTAPSDGDLRPPYRARVSRFAVPGTPAADLIFIDHFD